MTRPIITLKNIKYAAFASQETPCYTATVYVDGKKFGMVRNEGHGGGDYVDGVSHDAIRTLEERIAATYPPITDASTGLTYNQTLETLCGEALDTHLARKELKGKLRRSLIAKHTDGKFYRYANPTAERAVKLAAKPEVVAVLNNMDEDSALALWREEE